MKNDTTIGTTVPVMVTWGCFLKKPLEELSLNTESCDIIKRAL